LDTCLISFFKYMNKNILIIIGIIIIVLIIFSFLKPKEKGIEKQNEIIEVQIADKIEVVHFHGTNQCFSCIKVGEYALKTIQEKFKEEYENGTIVFIDINGELEENQEIVQKYKARGSSLFINSIIGSNDNIEEETTVWRLVNDESSYLKYFEDKLKTLLGR